MKFLAGTFSLIIMLSGCNNQTDDKTAELKTRIDSLEKRLNNTYKPGFGEFMSNIQIHHSKLWFAGENENWQLADFEIGEIMESLEDIKQYETERKESAMIPMLNPALDSINESIKQKNKSMFRSSFTLLTNTCNNCHKAAGFGFNVVKIPDSPPFTNQIFSIDKK